MKMVIADQELDLTFSSDGLLCWPSDWEEELNAHGFIEAASRVLTVMPSCALRTPWIIGSGTRSISGRMRSESKSHMDGLAFDMSPLFSKSEVLDPSGAIMGLAWNIVSLAIISPAYESYPHFVVEGDHLHVQPSSHLPEQRMLAAFTMPTWYSWTDIIRSDEVTSPLDGSFWIWDPNSANVHLASADEVNEYLNALRV